jgi:hypothetical protein
MIEWVRDGFRGRYTQDRNRVRRLFDEMGYVDAQREKADNGARASNQAPSIVVINDVQGP